MQIISDNGFIYCNVGHNNKKQEKLYFLNILERFNSNIITKIV